LAGFDASARQEMRSLSKKLRIPFPFFRASAATIVALAALLSLDQASASRERSDRVTEVIVLSMNRPGNPDDQNVLIRAARSLRRMKGVDHVHIGRALPGGRVQGEHSFDVAIVITFKNRFAWERFERNDQFQRLMDAALRPLVRRSIVYNFTSE